MDQFKKSIREIRKDRKTSAINTRRIQANLPSIERKLDIISGDSSYILEFPVSKYDHTISLDLKIRPDNCCECEPGAQTVKRDCIAYMSPSFPDPMWDQTNFSFIPTGEMQEAIYIPPLNQTGTVFNYGISSPFFFPFYQEYPAFGGFELTEDGGIKIPVDGMYSLMFKNLIEINAGEGTFLTIAVLQNSEPISRKIYSIQKNNLALGITKKVFFQYTSCVPLHKDDVVRAGLQSNADYWRIYGERTATENTFRITLLGLGFGVLAGTVTDQVTGLPIEGATVSYSIGFGGSTTTDAQGKYEFDELTPAPHTITVSKTGYTTQSRDITVLFDDIVYLDFNLI